MNRAVLEAYSEVILGCALSIKSGDRLWLRSEPVHLDFVKSLVRRAYEMGAEHVEVSLEDPAMGRIRLDSSVSEEFLDYVPGYMESMYGSIIEDGWRSLAIRGPSDPDLMHGVCTGRLARMTRAASMARRGFLSAISSNKIPWSVCLAPTGAWASKVLGDGVDWEERIWNVLIPILRLNCDDPAAAWREHDSELKRRASFLNSSDFRSFRFTGPGTDLVVGMRPDRRFCAGSSRSQDGTVFFPNIPTEEVFSTPDMYATSGTVKCTRPVTVLGAQVEGAWFRFESGRVSGCGAEQNGDVLEKYIETDRGASMLGEIALVGTDSPVYRSGLVFHNILFDENASCHIALGNGYADCIERGTELTPEELASAGCNQSLVHTDFMIGSEDVDVTGTGIDGKDTVIISRGRFAI